MRRYKQATLAEHYDAPFSDTIDTFNHLPPCPSRVLPPLRMKLSDLDISTELAEKPKDLRSDDEVIAWFFTVVNFVCTSLGVEFQLEYFIQRSAEGDPYLVTGALNSYRKHLLELSKDVSFLELIRICMVLFDLTQSHTLNHKMASDEARMLFTLTGEYIEKLYRRMTADAATLKLDKYTNRAGFDMVPPQLRFANSWDVMVSDIVAGRFYDSGKCMYTYSRISDLFGLSSAFYMSQLESLDRDLDHSKCSLNECFGHNIDPKTHIMAHTRMGCDCSTYEADLKTIEKILETPDLIPIMVFDDGPGIRTRVVPHTEVKEYITISYSASQLFASPLSNAMPYCQLRALKHVVQRCMRHRVMEGELCGVWIDTLHVPVPQIRTKYREQALMKMSKTFEEASVVLAVDPNLGARAATEFVPEEFMSYFLCSPWFTRLWTFSESQLAKNLWVWYAGRPLSVDQFLRDQNWPPVGHSWRRYDELETIGRMRLMSRSEQIPPIPREKTQEHAYFDIVLENVRHRQTSQASDEPFCLSLIMELDTSRILEAPKERQMEAFYSQLRNLSGILLIQSGERLATPGFRWAPKTLLGRKAVSRYGHDEDFTIRVDGLGIRMPATYPAFKLTLIKPTGPSSGSGNQSPSRLAFFQMTMQDIHQDTQVLDRRESKEYRCLTLGIPLDPKYPFNGDPNPFLPPGGQFIVAVRGFGGENNRGSCMVLKLESGIDSSQVQSRFEDKIGAEGHTPIMTSYHKLGTFTLNSKTKTEALQDQHNLKSAFKGHQPWTIERFVCDAERIDLQKYDIWIS